MIFSTVCNHKISDGRKREPVNFRLAVSAVRAVEAS
jgi:hypothetical protein